MSEDAKIVSIVLLSLVAIVSGGVGLWLFIDVVSGLGFGGLMFLAIPIGGLSFLCLICLVQIAKILGQDDQSTQSVGKQNTEVVVEHLSDIACLSPEFLYDIGFWRQPRVLHSAGSAGVSRKKAIQEIQAAFRSADIEIVNIEVNTNSELTVWRPACYGTGELEGEWLGGASIKRVLWQDA